MDYSNEFTLPVVIVFFIVAIFFFIISMKYYKIIADYYSDLLNRKLVLEKIIFDISEIKSNQVTKEEIYNIKEEQADLKEVLTEIRTAQKDIAEKQEIFEAQNRSLNLNKLRDRLLQSYRYYTSEEKNPMGAWSELEMEAFYRLFKDYEELGGNGFMHTIVKPAMDLLIVISMDNYEELSKLDSSRK